MANNEKLIFPIGFDLEEGVKKAGKDWKNHYRKRLQDAIDSRPLKVKIDFESKGIDTKEFKRWMVLAREAERLERERIKNAREWQKVADQAAMAETRRANATNESNARIERQNRKAEASERRKRDAVERTNEAYKRQGGYLSRLFQRMVAYASVAQAFSFVRNIREVTAEFELQRVALGSIIGDLNEANAMFEQIKAAAVKSPFQIKELVTYTKQLAAYKIESDELFETTQRLADISAGLGVGMERLVLAYGQIRATGYLRASEVRQLTEAGIPIVEELAKKMSQLRGETVSAAEVMGLISERAISFGMVKEVFDDMTSAGGMFYKMQEKQAETLAGQWSNLQDAISIMYDEIGNTEGVNNSIKGTIGLVKSLAENWRVVSSVVQSLSIAMGVYYVAMKNAAVASTALAASEARLAALEMTREARMPRLIALMLGQNKAITVTIALNKALVFSQKKALMATTALGKAFWRLTTAMLSNPYTAVLAALAGITFAIVKFATKTKTTQERIDDLNKSVTSLTDLKNDVKPLVDELDALSQKSNKTAQEQERLNQVTQELADKYPSTISAVREYGKEVDITAGKVRELYEAELKAKTVGLRAELVEDEKALENLRYKYNEIRAKQIRGTKFQYAGDGEFDYTMEEVPLTTKELAELNKEARELEEEMRPLEQSIHDAKVALGDITPEATRAIEAFGSWKQTIKDFKTGLKNDLGEDIKLFDDDIINQFTSLNNALDSVAEQYNKNDEAIKRYTQTLTSKKLTQAERKDIEDKKARATAFRDTASAILDYYNARSLLNKKKGGNEGESELSILQKELQLHEKIYAKYKEYRRYKSDEQAKAIVEDYFGDTIKSLMFEPKYDSQGFKQVLKQYQDYARTLPESEKVVLDIGFKVEDIDWQDTKSELEDNLKRLSDDLSRTKTAKEFFDRMLGLTGDRELAATLTMSVYGTTGDDLKSALVKQVQGAFEGQDLSKAINTDLNSIDLSALREIYNNLPEDFAEDQKKSMKQVLDMLEKGQNDLADNFAKLLMDYDEMEQKRVTITQKAAQEIATLEQGLQAQIEGIRQNKEITDKDSAIAQAQARAEAVRKAILAREKLELSKLSPEYIRFFSSINAMAMETANSTRTQLRRALFDAFEQGGISAEELRKELKAIDTQFNKLNENATLFSSYATGGFDAWLQKLQQSADELDAIAARMMKLKSIDQMDEGDKNFVNKMLRVFGDKGQKSLSDLATSFNGDMSQMGDAVQKVGGQMQGMFSSAMGAISIVDAIIKGVGQTIDGVGQVIDQINSMRSEDNQIGGWFKYIQDFNKYAMSGWENLKSGNIAGALADTVSSIISIFQNIQADKIKKLDEEIERQQELLDNLSYSYDRLQKSAERAFGTEYIQNYNRQLANLEAQVEAYEKQLEAERSKGKKADEEKIKEYQEQIRDTKDAIEDMYGSLSEHFLGTDLTSAARDFASAWIDAYKEFANTTDAMKAKFQDMIQNMIVESLLAKVMERALRDVFKMVDEMGDSDFYSNSFWSQLMTEMNKATENGVVGAQNIMGMLESIGINLRDTGTGLTGISRDIASASEESILGLAAGINTQNFYISQVPTKLDTIIGLLRGGSAVVDSGVNVQDLITIQNQFLSHLPTIAQNTAETVARCERAAVACESMASKLGSVIKPKGTTSTHSVNVTIGA